MKDIAACIIYKNYLIEKGVCFRKGKQNSTTCACF